MRIVFLGTLTKHRIYLINKIATSFELVGVLFERRRLRKPYPTGPFFDADEAEYEERLFAESPDGVARNLPAAVEKRVVDLHDLNQTGVSEYIQALRPDVIISSGAGLLKPEVYASAAWAAINVHLGISQAYRGLDSNLWAIYENRFDRLGVTVHYLEESLDTGDILAQDFFALEAGDEIYHLRYKATLVASALIEDCLRRFQENGAKVAGTPQSPGKYYSAMSLEQKQTALTNFRKHMQARSHV